MPEAHIHPRQEQDATNDYGDVRGVHETNNVRTLHLLIKPNGKTFRLEIQTDDPDLIALFGDNLEHELPLTEAELLGAVQSCRRTWNERLVQLIDGAICPFQAAWDLKDHPHLAKAVMPELARAGGKLFLALFFPRDPGDRERHQELRKIGLALRAAMASQTRWVRVSADSFYVPWGLIYSEPLGIDGSDWKPEGFWGYQHLIENAPMKKGGLKNELKAPDGGTLVVALQIDEWIDQQFPVPCIKPVEDVFKKYPPGRLTTVRRTRRLEVAKALHDGPLDEHVLFFCCHGIVDGVSAEIRNNEAYLILSDRSPDTRVDRITPADIQQWIDARSFYEDGRCPLVFLNACGSGQLNSIFYPSFGESFLRLGACSVIGAQVELPAIFAGEFARRFFERFLQGGLGNQVGKILYELRREFWDRHRNPLGLIYSLYRGADVFLRQGL